MRRKSPIRKIPKPPAISKSWEEKAAYFEKYSSDEIDASGYSRPLNDGEEVALKEITKKAEDSLSAKKNKPNH